MYKQLIETEEYARINEMKINYKKTKLMVFNPCTSIDFQPEWTLGGHELEFVEEMRLLASGAKREDLVDVYTKQIRSVLELAVPAWQEA